MPVTALLDLDGTLVDTNYQHALAWYRAFLAHGIVLPVWRIHRHIGMGGDQIVKALTDDEVESRLGDRLRRVKEEEFGAMRDECRPLHGAAELVAELNRRGITTILASSAGQADLDHFLSILDIRELVDGWTTSDDVQRTKPHPDIVHAALVRADHPPRAVMIGDSRWDVEAAAHAGLETIGVLTGGWSRQELLDAGAVAVFESLPELTRKLDRTPLGPDRSNRSPSSSAEKRR
jgi:HAD superfamily hydrolase (TIGR01509 family)